MFKPIAFLISKCFPAPDLEFYSDEIKLLSRRSTGFNIYIWYLGDPPKNNHNKFYFSYPKSKSLFDRNIILTLDINSIIVENDWLGSIPIYYNKEDLLVSTISNQCLINKDFEFDGLINYLQYGYSIFEKTSFRDVMFMRYYSKLIVTEKNINVIYKDDPVLCSNLFNEKCDVDEVIKSIQSYINEVEKNINGDIYIPLSGGYDSRLLCQLVKNKNRINSFTYGVSKIQSRSKESVIAKTIADRLGIKWERIELEDFYQYIDDWHRLFGFSTHIHGMYHIEFYKKILTSHTPSNQGKSLLSGIFGDIWAGSIKYSSIDRWEDIYKLSYTHGVALTNSSILMDTNRGDWKKFFNVHREALESDKYKSIFTVRFKIILISYLLQIPEYFGIPSWSPFLNLNVVAKILSLPDSERANRLWQKKYFSNSMDINNIRLRYSTSNTLDFDIAQKHDFSSIIHSPFTGIIKEKRIEYINNTLRKTGWVNNSINSMLTTRYLRGVLRRVGLKNRYLIALKEYFVIKAIEKSL